VLVILSGWLALAGTQPASAQSTSRLQTLLNDTVAQLQLAYRHNVPEQRRRYDQLALVVNAWREAPRSDANNRLLEDWLRGAIRSSMPGSQQFLPTAPNFEVPIVPVDLEDDPTESIAPAITRSPEESVDSLPPGDEPEEPQARDADIEKWDGDPFADDPA
jgi:hypothetical protein